MSGQPKNFFQTEFKQENFYETNLHKTNRSKLVEIVLEIVVAILAITNVLLLLDPFSILPFPWNPNLFIERIVLAGVIILGSIIYIQLKIKGGL